MKRTITCLVVLLLASTTVTSAQAGHLGCGGGDSQVSDCTDHGAVAADYKGGHWFAHCFKRGIFPGFAGFHHDPKPARFPDGGPQVQPNLVFPTHNYARSPRDFYMLDN